MMYFIKHDFLSQVFHRLFRIVFFLWTGTKDYSYHCELADKLESKQNLTDDAFYAVLTFEDPDFSAYLAGKARAVRERIYHRDVYIRGLIEFTNYCKNNCSYCGIRGGNKNAERYRLSEEDILSCTDQGVEDLYDAWLSAKVFAVSRKGQDGSGRALMHQGIKDLLVGVNDRV